MLNDKIKNVDIKSSNLTNHVKVFNSDLAIKNYKLKRGWTESACDMLIKQQYLIHSLFITDFLHYLHCHRLLYIPI